MPITIASCCRRFAAILRNRSRTIRARYEARRWRRALLRALRQRSRE